MFLYDDFSILNKKCVCCKSKFHDILKCPLIHYNLDKFTNIRIYQKLNKNQNRFYKKRKKTVKSKFIKIYNENESKFDSSPIEEKINTNKSRSNEKITLEEKKNTNKSRSNEKLTLEEKINVSNISRSNEKLTLEEKKNDSNISRSNEKLSILYENNSSEDLQICSIENNIFLNDKNLSSKDYIQCNENSFSNEVQSIFLKNDPSMDVSEDSNITIAMKKENLPKDLKENFLEEYNFEIIGNNENSEKKNNKKEPQSSSVIESIANISLLQGESIQSELIKSEKNNSEENENFESLAANNLRIQLEKIEKSLEILNTFILKNVHSDRKKIENNNSFLCIDK